MIDKCIILTYFIKLVFTQISGELWYHKLTQLKGVEALTPAYKNHGEFEAELSDKIVLKDINLLTSLKPAINSVRINENTSNAIDKIKEKNQFNNKNIIMWPTDTEIFATDNTSTQITVNANGQEKVVKSTNDALKIFMPGDYDTGITSINKHYVSAPTKDKLNEKYANDFHKLKYISITNKAMKSENICSHITKIECHRKNGFVYNQIERSDALICCILPLPIEKASKIILHDTFMNKPKRYRRSPGQIINPVLKQRNVLLKRKYDVISSTQREVKPKIVSSEEDYIDPYWNIKSSSIKYLSPQYNPTEINNDCYQDYVEDYKSEVPKPGLLGVYSNYGGSAYGANIEEYDYNDDTPAYFTIDPRRSTVSPFTEIGKPPNPLTESGEISYNPESQTISYQSSPDFQVLHGFKLLNLARNKNKFYSNSKNTRKTATAESTFEKNSEESIIIKSSSENYFFDKQVYKACGTPTTSPISNGIVGKHFGSAENGSHPWLALVVESKRRRNIICYATIVHPRAAMSAADCVHGVSNGEITLIAGLWDLKDRSQSQTRLTSVVLHPQYKPDDLAHNLAVLYWTHPLKLGLNVQPVCIGEPNADEDCKLFGWGGYDQAFRPRSHWQSATILTGRQCNARLSSNKSGPRIPADAFCATVQSRGTVSGIGGPLVCDKDGRSTATGVAVWRDSVIVFMPTSEWPRRTVLQLLTN